MQCLYCGNRISLLRKLKDSEFCSEEHRDLYQQEQTALALARLTESGNRMNQPRRPVEPLEPVEDAPVAAVHGEPVELPEPFGFFIEIPELSHPRRFHADAADVDWLTATALPELFECSGGAVAWSPAEYFRPVLLLDPAGMGRLRLGGAIGQTDFKSRNPEILASDLALDLSGVPAPPKPQLAPQKQPAPQKAQLPPQKAQPIPQKVQPVPQKAQPVPQKPQPVPQKAQPALQKLQPVPQKTKRVEPQYPVAPSLPVPLEAIAPSSKTASRLSGQASFTPATPVIDQQAGLLSSAPDLASTLPVTLTAIAPLAAWKTPRMWPAVPRVTVRTLIDGPSTRARVPVFAAALGWENETGTLAPAVDQPLAACTIDAREPEPSDAIDVTVSRKLPAGAELGQPELMLTPCRMSQPDVELGWIGMVSPDLEFAAWASSVASLPAFDVTPVAGIDVVGEYAHMPLQSVDIPGESAEAGGEIDYQAERLLPEFTWALASPQLNVEGGLCPIQTQAHSLPPRAVAGADRVMPMVARSKGGRKLAAKTVLPSANLPLVQPRLSYSRSMAPLVVPPDVSGSMNVAPPDMCAFIPSRRRPEMKARMAMPSAGQYVRCRGMASSTTLARLDLDTGSAADWQAEESTSGRLSGWTLFPPPEKPSPDAMFNRQPLGIESGTIRTITRMFPISLANSATVAPPVRPVGASAPHTVCRPPRLPVFTAPQDGEQMHERTSALLSAMIERLDGAPARWALTRLWRRAPLSIKALVAGAVILGSLTTMGGGSKSMQLGSLREEIRGRAAVDLVDDFRAGMGAWRGAENWAETWSYDSAGFVQTGQLALYRPSMNLANYRFEFLGQIANKSVGWVFRAVDTQNYYAMKIVCTNTGPMPAASLVRYAVIDGKPGPKTELPLPMGARTDMMYRIRVDAEGPNFTAQFQDQVVDVWSDARLAAGGIGFFSDKGEKARIRWIEVSHHSDFLGKLCAYLVPFDAHSADRSMTR